MASHRSTRVTDEPIPLVSMTREQAERALREAQQVSAMMTTPEWSVAERALDEFHRAATTQLIGIPPEQLAAHQQVLAGYDMPRRICMEMLRRAQTAKDAKGALAAAPPREWSGTEYGDVAIQENLAAAGHIRTLVEHEGWVLLMREFAARARAHASMLASAAENEAHHHKAVIAGMINMLFKLQAILDLGADTEAFLRVRAERQEREGD